MFSIIIPTLNEEKVIEKTIKQFDNVRDIYNLEFIVSDSNSCDRTVDISKKNADKVVIHKSNSCNRLIRGIKRDHWNLDIIFL